MSILTRERYPVNLRYPRDNRDSLEKLQNLSIITAKGAHIPLKEVATVYVTEGPDSLKSENARLNGWVFIDIHDRDLGSYVQEAKKLLIQKLKLPPGYSIAWSGQYQYLERAKERLYLIVPLTLAIIMLLLYLNFRSFLKYSLSLERCH